MFYNQKMETLAADELKQLQIERLQYTLNRVYRNVAFYHELFDRHAINIEKIKSMADLKELPFTTKQDLRQSYPYDMFAVPLRDIVRLHQTSGTTGQPIVVGYTQNDLLHWTECTARLLVSAGISENDVVQISFLYSLFTGGFGFHQGAERLGASVIPCSSVTSPEKQVTIMKDFKTTVLLCTPSYALNIICELEDKNIHPEQLLLKTGLFGAEPWTDKMREKIEAKLRISALDNYGLTEIMGPGIAGECGQKDGLHVNEDHFIVEVINPQTQLPVGPDEEGELVFTTITKEGFPLIRYRTGDISSLMPGTCPCGKTFVRIHRITGRTDDLIFFEEEKVFPSTIERILLQAEGTEPHYQIILEREGAQDRMEIRVEISENIPGIDKLRTLEELKHKIAQKIRAELNITARITLVEPRGLARADGNKTQRVIDRRAL